MKLYFICPYESRPVGGIKQIYRQVDILNKAGLEAFVVHPNEGDRCEWFQNETKIIYNSKIFDELHQRKSKSLKKRFKKIFSNADLSEGILVIPEIFGANISKISYDNNFVIFNQNCFYTFNGFSLFKEVNEYPYNSKKHLGTIVVSANSKEYLDYSFEGIDAHKITLGIDTTKFSYSKDKKLRVAYMPRKLEEDVNQVIQILKARNSIGNWEFTPIDNKSEEEVALILKESAIFLSFNHREGFGLPPLEALACGCVVIGYTGQGGKEYFENTFSYAIENGDIFNFVKKIEEVADTYIENENSILEKCNNNYLFVKENYNFKKEEETILNFWRKLID